MHVLFFLSPVAHSALFFSIYLTQSTLHEARSANVRSIDNTYPRSGLTAPGELRNCLHPAFHFTGAKEKILTTKQLLENIYLVDEDADFCVLLTNRNGQAGCIGAFVS